MKSVCWSLCRSSHFHFTVRFWLKYLYFSALVYILLQSYGQDFSACREKLQNACVVLGSPTRALRALRKATWSSPECRASAVVKAPHRSQKPLVTLLLWKAPWEGGIFWGADLPPSTLLVSTAPTCSICTDHVVPNLSFCSWTQNAQKL